MTMDTSQAYIKPEMPTAMDTDGPEPYPPATSGGMVYGLEAQPRNVWNTYGIQPQPSALTSGDTPSVSFGNVDINSANSNLMLLQGQTYGAMPGGGSAMALEDIFGDEWADQMIPQQIYRS